MNSRRFFNLLIIVCLGISVSSSTIYSDKKPKHEQKTFPDLTFKNILSHNDQTYLGISRKASFNFREITGTLIIVDLTNTYCFNCKKNIPILNEVYKTIQNHSTLKGKVKIVGIAIGNTIKEIESFKKEYKPLYPLVVDPHFAAHKALGSPRVPYILYIRSNKAGDRIICKTHQGVLDSSVSVMNDINKLISQVF